MDKRYQIIWSDLTLHQVKKVCRFYIDKTGNTIFSEKLTSEIDHMINLISSNPEFGKLLKNTNFRYVNISPFILLYRVSDNIIYLVLFWDNRRNPKTLKFLLEELS